MVIPLVTKLVAPDRYWQERQWGLCVWDDIIEFTGPMAIKYQNIFLPVMLEYMNDQSAEVRQAAAYGAGIMAQFGREAFAGMKALQYNCPMRLTSEEMRLGYLVLDTTCFNYRGLQAIYSETYKCYQPT